MDKEALDSLVSRMHKANTPGFGTASVHSYDPPIVAIQTTSAANAAQVEFYFQEAMKRTAMQADGTTIHVAY